MHFCWPKVKVRRIQIDPEHVRYEVIQRPIVRIIWSEHQRTIIFGNGIVGIITIQFRWGT